MSYRFLGFLVRDISTPPKELPKAAVWRPITEPFAGIGVRWNPDAEQLPKLSDADARAEQLGLDSAGDWLFLDYSCWAGRIDSVRGQGRRGMQSLGPVDETDVDKAQEVYVDLMNTFGVAPEDALAFPPFTRGFWGTA